MYADELGLLFDHFCDPQASTIDLQHLLSSLLPSLSEANLHTNGADASHRANGAANGGTYGAGASTIGMNGAGGGTGSFKPHAAPPAAISMHDMIQGDNTVALRRYSPKDITDMLRVKLQQRVAVGGTAYQFQVACRIFAEGQNMSNGSFTLRSLREKLAIKFGASTCAWPSSLLERPKLKTHTNPPIHQSTTAQGSTSAPPPLSNGRNIKSAHTHIHHHPGLHFRDDDFEAFFNGLDLNHDGTVQLQEFVKVLSERDYHGQHQLWDKTQSETYELGSQPKPGQEAQKPREPNHLEDLPK